jgi:hypothetical protein
MDRVTTKQAQLSINFIGARWSAGSAVHCLLSNALKSLAAVVV